MESTKKPVARMRGLKEAHAELVALDPSTSISRNYIRTLAISGKIPVAMVGKRRLINLDGLIDFLNNEGSATANEKPPEIGKIRRVV